MKKNYLFALLATAILSSASLSFGTTSTYTNAIVGDSPVSFWPLNETSGTLIHDVVGTNNGFATNAGSLTLGAPGILFSNGFPSDTAIAFNPTGSGTGFILTPASGENFTTNITDALHFSVEGWFFVPTTFSSSVPERCMISCDTSCPQGWQMAFQNATTSPIPIGEVGESEGWDTPAQNFGTGPHPNKWSHYVMTYDGTTLKLYTNGVMSASLACAYNPETSFDRGPLFIGAYDATCPATNIIPANYFQGSIENVAFYNRALTASQITNHYYAGTNAGPNAPSIGPQPASQTNYVGLASTFIVSAGGTAPLSYQWKVQSSGSYVNLSNGGQFSGVTNTTLTISSLALTNSTNYEVVVTNSVGSVTSAPAALTVLNPTGPSINTQPASQTNYVGLTNTFTVGINGTPPLSYQWQVEANGVYVNLSNSGQFSGVTNPTFSISGLVLTNATNYDVVVTNSVGSVTSAPASLTVLTNLPYQTVILADNPVSYWPMQETNGPILHDIVTTNAGPFNGTLQISTDGFASGAADSEGKNWGIIHETFTNSASTAATDGATYLFGGSGPLTGISGDKAVYFTNLNGQLNCAQIAMGTGGTGAYEAQLDASVFSVEAWVNVPTYPIGWTSNTYQVPVCGFCQGGTSDGWFMALNTDSSGSSGAMFAGMGLGTSATFANEGPSAQVFSGKWVYVVQEQNAAGFTVVYTNGTLLLSNSVAYKPLSNHASGEVPLMIGSLGAYYFGGSAFSGYTRSQFWDGGVSHVAYYNSALSAGRVSAHYQAGSAVVILPPPTPTLSIQPSGTNVSVSWTNGFLQQAGSARGPWTDVLPTNETSPQVIAATNSQLFYRASSQP